MPGDFKEQPLSPEQWFIELERLIETTTPFSSTTDIDKRLGVNDWKAMFQWGDTPQEALDYVLDPMPTPDEDPIWPQ